MAKKFDKTSCSKCKKVFEYEVGFFKDLPESAGLFSGYLCPDCSREKKIVSANKKTDEESLQRTKLEKIMAKEKEGRQREQMRQERLEQEWDEKVERDLLRSERRKEREQELEAYLLSLTAKERQIFLQERNLRIAIAKTESEERAIKEKAEAEQRVINAKAKASSELIDTACAGLVILAILAGLTYLAIYLYEESAHWYSIALFWVLKWFIYAVDLIAAWNGMTFAFKTLFKRGNI